MVNLSTALSCKIRETNSEVSFIISVNVRVEFTQGQDSVGPTRGPSAGMGSPTVVKSSCWCYQENVSSTKLTAGK